MATVTGVINKAIGQTLQGVPGSAGGTSNWQTPGYIRGNVQAYTDYYVGLGTELTGTVIKMHPLLDVGLMILYHVLTVVASTGALTGSIGDLDSATRYANAITSFATAGTYIIGNGLGSTGMYIIGTNPATPTATDTDAQIVITTGGATLGATNIFSLSTVYVAD